MLLSLPQIKILSCKLLCAIGATISTTVRQFQEPKKKMYFENSMFTEQNIMSQKLNLQKGLMTTIN
jgi:hypothetical protein